MDKVTLERLLDFDMEDIAGWYSEKENLPIAVAREHATELKRYLALRAANPDTRYAMAGPVDELWHYFVLATTQYLEFCDLAGSFLHHRPKALDKPGEADPQAYERMLSDYTVFYGEAPPAECWPQPRFLTAVGAGACCGVCT